MSESTIVFEHLHVVRFEQGGFAFDCSQSGDDAWEISQLGQASIRGGGEYSSDFGT